MPDANRKCWGELGRWLISRHRGTSSWWVIPPDADDGDLDQITIHATFDEARRAFIAATSAGR